MAKTRKKSPQDLRRFSLICESKRPFKTEQLALKAADFGMLQDMSISLGVYQCSVCNQWHLTTSGTFKN